MPQQNAKNKSRRKMLIKQKLMGLVLIVISALIFVMASTGRTVEERDCTAVLFFLPLGIALLFSKQILIIA